MEFSLGEKVLVGRQHGIITHVYLGGPYRNISKYGVTFKGLFGTKTKIIDSFEIFKILEEEKPTTEETNAN